MLAIVISQLDLKPGHRKYHGRKKLVNMRRKLEDKNREGSLASCLACAIRPQ
jgi:hypothetical protein